MENVFNFLRLAKPFLELAYTGALLLAPSVAVEIRAAIDAIDRAGNVSHSARGLAEITAYCEQVLAGINNIIADATLSVEQKRQQASDLAHTLSDPLRVYQAKRGADHDVLEHTKTQAQALVNSIA